MKSTDNVKPKLYMQVQQESGKHVNSACCLRGWPGMFERTDIQPTATVLMMDRLVYGCYRAINHLPWFVSYSMLYFVAASRYEQNRLNAGPRDFIGAFMGTDQLAWNRTMDQILNKLETDLNRTGISPE